MKSRIVVGVDGSPESVEALRYAVDEARLHEATLVVVAAYSYPYATLVVPLGPEPPVPEEWKRDVVARIDRALESLRGSGVELAGLEIEIEAVEGQPAAVLLEAAKDADLLVLGARGLGGFRGMLLGSVSQQCVQHARCPVLIVRKRT
jgi:nucleotide-binding universal stress UspA family protein